MQLSSTQIRYLLTIYEMLEQGPVRLCDVASAMQVSKPSVHGMEEQFVRLGLLEKARYAPIRMSEKGRQVVEEYAGQLTLLSRQLERALHLSPQLARESALVLLGEWPEMCREKVSLYLCE